MEGGRRMEAGESTAADYYHNNDMRHHQQQQRGKLRKKKGSSRRHHHQQRRAQSPSSSRSRNDSSYSRYGTPSEGYGHSTTRKKKKKKSSKNKTKSSRVSSSGEIPSSSGGAYHSQHPPQYSRPQPPAKTPKPPPSSSTSEKTNKKKKSKNRHVSSRHYKHDSRDDDDLVQASAAVLEEEGSSPFQSISSSSRRRKWSSQQQQHLFPPYNINNYNHRNRCETTETRYSTARETLPSEDTTSRCIFSYQKKESLLSSSTQAAESSAYYDANDDEIYTFNIKSLYNPLPPPSSSQHHHVNESVGDYVSPTADGGHDYHHHQPQYYPTPPTLQDAHWNISKTPHRSYHHHGPEKHRHLYTASTFASSDHFTKSSSIGHNLNHDMDHEAASSSSSSDKHPELLLATPATPAESIWHHVSKFFTGTFSFCSPLDDQKLKNNDGTSSDSEEENKEEEHDGEYGDEYPWNHPPELAGSDLLPSTSKSTSFSHSQNHDSAYLEYSDMEASETAEQHDEEEDVGSSVFFGGDDRTKSFDQNDDYNDHHGVYNHNNYGDYDTSLGCSPHSHFLTPSPLQHKHHHYVSKKKGTRSEAHNNTVEISFMDETNGSIDPHFFRASILRDPTLLMGCRYSGWDGKRSHYTAMVPLSSFHSPPSTREHKEKSSEQQQQQQKSAVLSSITTANLKPFQTPDSTIGSSSSFQDEDNVSCFQILSNSTPGKDHQQAKIGNASAVVHIVPSPPKDSQQQQQLKQPSKQQQQQQQQVKTTIDSIPTSLQQQQQQQMPQQIHRGTGGATHRKQQSSISEMTTDLHHDDDDDENDDCQHFLDDINNVNDTTTDISQSPISIAMPPEDEHNEEEEHNRLDYTISPTQKELMDEFLSSSSSSSNNNYSNNNNNEQHLKHNNNASITRSPPLVPTSRTISPPPLSGTGSYLGGGLGRPPLIKNRSDKTLPQQPPPLPPHQSSTHNLHHSHQQQQNRARSNTGNSGGTVNTTNTSCFSRSSTGTNGSYHRRTDSTLFFTPDMLSLISEDNENPMNNNMKKQTKKQKGEIPPLSPTNNNNRTKGCSPTSTAAISQTPKHITTTTTAPAAPLAACTTPYHKRQYSQTSISKTVPIVNLDSNAELADVSPIDAEDDLGIGSPSCDAMQKRDGNASENEEDIEDPFMKQRKGGYVVKREDGVECTPIRRSNSSGDDYSFDKRRQNEDEQDDDDSSKERQHFFPRPNQKNGTTVKLFEEDEEAEEKRRKRYDFPHGKSSSSNMPKSAKKKKDKKTPSAAALSISNKQQQFNMNETNDYFLPKSSAFIKELRSSGRRGNCIFQGWVAFSKGTKIIQTLQKQQQQQPQDESDNVIECSPGLVRNDFRYAVILDDGPYLHLFTRKKSSKSTDGIDDIHKSNGAGDGGGETGEVVGSGVNSKVLSIDLSQNISLETRLVSKKHGRCIILVNNNSNNNTKNKVICTMLPVSLEPSFFRDTTKSRLVNDRKFESIRHLIFAASPTAVSSSHDDYSSISRFESHVVHHHPSQRKSKKGTNNSGSSRSSFGEWGDPYFVEECFAPVAQLEAVMHILFAIDGAMKVECSLVWN